MKKQVLDDSIYIQPNDPIKGAWWLSSASHLPQTCRVGLIPTSAMCVHFACSPCASVVSSRCDSWFPVKLCRISTIENGWMIQ